MVTFSADAVAHSTGEDIAGASDGQLEFLDNSTRPHAPKFDGVTEEQRESGRHSAMIHAMHLAELDAARRAMERVEAGEASASAVANSVSALQMGSNYRRFGNLCGRECRMLEFHHTAESHYIFPLLRDADPKLREVVDRLSAEHEVIGRLLDRLEHAAAAAVAAPGPGEFRAAEGCIRHAGARRALALRLRADRACGSARLFRRADVRMPASAASGPPANGKREVPSISAEL